MSDADRELPVSFQLLVYSFAQSALVSLGELEDPVEGGSDQDLARAKHAIDMLALIETKTEGNLDAEEAKLLESVLADLRMKYVEAAGGR